MDCDITSVNCVHLTYIHDQITFQLQKGKILENWSPNIFLQETVQTLHLSDNRYATVIAPFTYDRLFLSQIGIDGSKLAAAFSSVRLHPVADRSVFLTERMVHMIMSVSNDILYL
ncbi:hypothetical protein TNCV_2097031 [Trichonephila clavipes]|nr:hypothetical protein TNCV_2097031 [Trichonephila clavipes]